MYTTDFKQVGTNIKRELESRGMTQQKLADALGVSKQVMNKIIKGLKAINVTELAKIAAALGVTTDTLLNAETASVPAVSLSFMGKIKTEEEQNKIDFIRSAIDDIYFLEELLHD
ncbi:MAG: helix-turn-helix transcriptional regulator [Ruminococcus sp.]|nr:helix-turn-helix transcriptional regulator [Ruminococcus sp.]